MHTLVHFRLCPHSRAIRIALAELGIETELAEEQPWEWREELLALNPAGELPVLQVEGAPPVCGVHAISEYLAETAADDPDAPAAIALFPGSRHERAEVRRLADWFTSKLNREVTQELLTERVYTRLHPRATRKPDLEILRAIRANLRYHMSYVSYLAHHRRWLAGEELSFADLAAAAHLSTIDYLGEVPWDEYAPAKVWYQRLKSRRAFRSILTDRLPGSLPPEHYANLDF